MKRIAYTRPDGGVSVVNLAPKGRGKVLVSEAIYGPVLIQEEVTDDEGTVTQEALYEEMEIESAVYRDETDEEFLARVRAKDVPADATDVIETDDIPTDRAFRDAWRIASGKCDVDMPKAREIQKARIRAERNAKLAEMDNETRRLEGLARLGKASDDDLTAHEQDKQALRDLPNGADGTDMQCDAADTPETLKAVWPFDGEPE